MTGKKITMIGADKAHFLCVSKESSRLLDFPDGISRHITLKSWCWEVLDRLHNDKGWSKSEIPNLAFEHAIEGVIHPEDFEKQLRFSFKLFIEINMAYVMLPNESTANERF